MMENGSKKSTLQRASDVYVFESVSGILLLVGSIPARAKDAHIVCRRCGKMLRLG